MSLTSASFPQRLTPWRGTATGLQRLQRHVVARARPHAIEQRSRRFRMPWRRLLDTQIEIGPSSDPARRWLRVCAAVWRSEPSLRRMRPNNAVNARTGCGTATRMASCAAPVLEEAPSPLAGRTTDVGDPARDLLTVSLSDPLRMLGRTFQPLFIQTHCRKATVRMWRQRVRERRPSPRSVHHWGQPGTPERPGRMSLRFSPPRHDRCRRSTVECCSSCPTHSR